VILMALGRLYNVLRLGKTRIEADTLEVRDVNYMDAAGVEVTAAAVTATGHVSASGARVDRLHRHEFTEIDISATAATLVGPTFPVAGTVLRAYMVVTEAIADESITTAKISLGHAGADGSTGASTAAVVALTAPTKADPVGTVVPLTIATGAIGAGKVLTASHVTQAIAGKVKIVVEYTLG